MNVIKIRYYIVGFVSLGLSVLIFLMNILAEQSNNNEAFMAIMAVVAAAIAYIEIYKNSLTSRGEFILNLQQTYTDNPEFTKLFLKCWDEYNFKVRNIDSKEYRKTIVDYLTFFESMYIMLEKGCLTIQLIDELFARRFFIVVNNVKVQECELTKDNNYKYYLNIYRLYVEWKKYRVIQEKMQKKHNPNYEDELIHKSNLQYRDLQDSLKPNFKVRKKGII